jgi:hypothetical protein
MTPIQKEMLEVYGKTNRIPSVSAFAFDFGITKDEARIIIDEWKMNKDQGHESIEKEPPTEPIVLTTNETGKSHGNVRREVPGAPYGHSHETTPIGNKGVLELAHGIHTRGPWIRWAIKILALSIAISSLARGFIIIQEYNGNNWFSFLMPLIMQGVSLLFPVMGFMEIEKIRLKRLAPIAGAIFFFSFSAISLYYEIQVSIQSFQKVETYNLSRQGELQDEANKNRNSNQIIDQKIANVRILLEADQELMKKRMEEFMKAKEGTRQYKDLQMRINNIQSEMAKYSQDIQSQLDKKQSDYVGTSIKYNNLITIAPAVIIPIVVPITFGIFLVF